MREIVLILMKAWSTLWFAGIGAMIASGLTFLTGALVDEMQLTDHPKIDQARKFLAIGTLTACVCAGGIFGWNGGFENAGNGRCGGTGPFEDCR